MPSIPFRVSRLWLVVLAVAALALFGSAPARATFSLCDYDSATSSVLAVAGSDSGSFLTRDASGAILADGADCDGATVANTDEILITSNDPNVAAAVDLSGGPFAPGFTDEGDGTSEIEITFNLPGDSLPTLIGGAGNDRFTAGAGGVNLNAGETTGIDADVTIVGTPTLTLVGEGGSDMLFASGGDGTGGPAATVVLIEGGDDGDWLIGGSAGDRIFGGNGFDELEGAAGDDFLSGGADADWAEYPGATLPVTATLPGGTAAGADGYGATDTYDSIERLAGSAQADVLTGDGGDNIVTGAGGNDTLVLGGGADLSWGGPGNDAIDGGRGNDGLSGDDGNDQLVGGGDDDDISDGAGNDTVLGGSGNDELDASGFVPDLGIGPSGADLLSGGPGIDTVHYWPRTAGVRVTLDGSANDGAVGEGDNVGGPRNDVENVEGGFGNDIIFGNNRANALSGLDGNDWVLGGGGPDRISGGSGPDVLSGGLGADAFDADDDVLDTVFGGPGFDTAAVDRVSDGDPVTDLTSGVESLS